MFIGSKVLSTEARQFLEELRKVIMRLALHPAVLMAYWPYSQLY